MVNGQEKKKYKFLVVSNIGCGTNIAYQLKKEGNDVKIFIQESSESDLLDNVVEKVDDWEREKSWADIIIFDDTFFGFRQNELRQQGFKVIGGSYLGDQIELDRKLALDYFKKMNVKIPQTYDFNSFASAKRFLKEQENKRFIIKFEGKAGDEKSLLYLSQRPDNSDLIRIIDHYSKNWNTAWGDPDFVLQEIVEGVETAVTAFFNGEKFLMPVYMNFENKRFLTGDLGVMTGEMGCYDENTEVLTNSGWKFFKDLTYDNEICTLNPKTNEIEYHRPLNLVEYGHHKKLVKIENNTLDMMVTFNHNMFGVEANAFRRGARTFDFTHAIDLPSQFVIPRTGIWNGVEQSVFVLPSVEIQHHCGHQMVSQSTKPIEIAMDDWLMFLGIYLADGFSYKNGNSYRVCITQKTEYKNEIIRGMLNRLPFEFKEDKDGFVCYSKQLSSYLSQFGGAGEKSVPDFVKSLSKRQIDMFLNMFCPGDGTCMKGGWRIFYTISRKLADDIQELLLKTGKVGTIKERDRTGRKNFSDGHWIEAKHVCYEVMERVNKLVSWLDKRDRQIVDYNGCVYCAEVPNHVMYVRRNGKPYWCGNTHGFFTFDKLKLFKNTLKKVEDDLKKDGYVGTIDVNCIINEEGIWPLEFTSRFGYPLINLIIEAIRGRTRFTDLMVGLVDKTMDFIETDDGYQVGVLVCVPTFPYEDGYERYGKELPVILLDDSVKDQFHLGDLKIENGDWVTAGSIGYGFVVTGRGDTIFDAKTHAYNNLKKIIVPNAIYRIDISDRWIRDYPKLHRWGFV